MMETPSIGSTNYAAALTQSANVVNAFGAMPQQLGAQNQFHGGFPNGVVPIPAVIKQEAKMAEFNTRLVKVFIVDPNANLPLANRLLYQGDEKLTDLTDQELFFEVDINGLLAKHNEVRTKTEDKKANKDKPVYLEAARVRDLKMQVVVLAQF